MGCYCCVRGCNNKSGNKKKTPDFNITFHAFPSNPELKRKWVKAIGRPDWSPPSHARICSSHFDLHQIKSEGFRTRIHDDAVPLQGLPLNSNFEASNVEVCRICLAYDVKMYSILQGSLKTFMDSMTTLTHNEKIEGLPNFICYLCAAVLRKSYRLIENSMLAQTSLLDIFAKEGRITKSLVKSKISMDLLIKPHLTIHTATQVYEYIYSEEKNMSIPKTIKTNIENENNIKHNDLAYKINTSIDVQQTTTQYDCVSFNEAEEMFFDDKASINDCESGDEGIEQKINDSDDENHLEISQYDSENEDDKTLNLLVRNCDTEKNSTKTKRKIRKKNLDGLTPEEMKMEKYFAIVKLSVPQQILEWNKSLAKRKFSSANTFKCEICLKKFAHSNTYKMHIGSHDPKRGDSVCQICKIRFKSDVLVTKHAKIAHTKKFQCRICHKVYNYVHVAKKHHLWHTGHRYKCASCPFTSVHECSLSVHVRSRHCSRSAVCSYCGHGFVSERGLKLHLTSVHGDVREPVVDSSYRCEECDISFISEGARRVHFLTSVLHKHKSSSICAPTQDINKACNRCGEQFPSTQELFAHVRREHSRTNTKAGWSMPGDRYPATCEHCDVTVSSRSEHWRHVLRRHPALRHLYRAVVTAVCQTCGKGFQNSTKLRHHMLRHSSPSVPCDECPRLFYDKYAVERHRRSVHAVTRPYHCTVCHKRFAASSNLYRHYRVHTGDTPYECSICNKKFKHSTSMNLHVRTVHHKMPHPPRKKRKANKSSEASVGLENQ